MADEKSPAAAVAAAGAGAEARMLPAAVAAAAAACMLASCCCTCASCRSAAAAALPQRSASSFAACTRHKSTHASEGSIYLLPSLTAMANNTLLCRQTDCPLQVQRQLAQLQLPSHTINARCPCSPSPAHTCACCCSMASRLSAAATAASNSSFSRCAAAARWWSSSCCLCRAAADSSSSACCSSVAWMSCRHAQRHAGHSRPLPWRCTPTHATTHPGSCGICLLDGASPMTAH